MKRSIFTDSEMVETLSHVNPKPVVYSGQSFNFTALNDRVFEILLYQIFKARIESNDYTLNNAFDGVVLMQGVGERGRDCFLTKKGKNVGVIQCKQVNKNLTKPEVLKEILKFVLHYILDKSLISNINNFTYYFVVSRGFAETSINLLSDFNKKYSNEDIQTVCQSQIKTYSAFKSLKYEDISEEIKLVLNKICIKPIHPTDLSQYLFEHEKLIKHFFRVMTVTDNTLLEAIIDNYLAPILSKLYQKKDRSYIDFTFRFKEYLQRVYSYYSSSRTLIFGNQQKKLEDFYYPLNLECSLSIEINKKISVNTFQYEDDFLPEYKKVLIVDNGGMGKSTIMKWLFLSVIKQRKGIPIFIELRKLKQRKTIIDEIISELNPIDEEIERDIVTKLIAQGNFVFFFDGYDEISDEDREFVTADLQSFISKSINNLFIMTSRPETALNTFSDFKEFRVKKLLEEEAFELIKKIGKNGDKAMRLISKIKENDIQNIDEFLQSPLLVSLLYKKFEHRENIPLHLQEFYYDVFEALFQDHDLTKGESYTRNKKTKLAFTEFFQVLRELAFLTLKKGEIEYNDSVLFKYLNDVSKRLPNIKFKPSDFIEDLVKSVPLFNKEGLQYRWSHKSFQEYFAAEFICRDSKENQIGILQALNNSPKSEKYYFVLSLCYDIDFKPFREALIIPYLKDFITYYDQSYDELVKKGLNKTEINIRKILTFNKIHLIAPSGKTDIILQAISMLKDENENENQKLSGFPDFIPDNYRLKIITVGEVLLFTAVLRNDLLELFTSKKCDFLSQVKSSKGTKKITEVFTGSKIPEFIIVDNIVNESNHDDLSLTYFNNLIANQISSRDANLLDYNKTRKFINDYNKETQQTNDDYFVSGF
jgi:hypothetical protein